MPLEQMKLEAFQALPHNLKKSDYVDILLLLIGVKKNVRLGINNLSIYQEMQKWCIIYHYKNIIFMDCMYISTSLIGVYLTCYIDNLSIPHAYILGRLLGYPLCCCKNIKILGENQIDLWEEQLCQKDNFIGEYALIFPMGYKDGKAYISHVPCKASCQPSLIIAKKVFDLVEEYNYLSCFKNWNSF